MKLYKGKEPIFTEFGVNKQMAGLFGRIVTIRNGVYLIIEHTEAMHVIDVNSGHRVNKENTQEENALAVNLEAAKEIARLLRLRDMGPQPTRLQELGTMVVSGKEVTWWSYCRCRT